MPRASASGPLRARFGVATGDAGGGALRDLPLDAITPNPSQPRTRFDADALAALAASIAQRGLLQPIVVRPAGAERYEIVAGERRWRASRQAGLTRIAAVVRVGDDSAALQDALIENMVREDLSAVEEARCLKLLIDDLGVSRAALARELGGRSRADLSNTLRLLDLPDDVLELIHAGKLTKGHGKALLAVGDVAQRVALAERAATEGWSVRTLEQHTRASAPGRTVPRASVPASQREIAKRLTAALVERVDGGRVTARPDGFTLHLPVDRVGELEEFVERLTRSR